MTDYIQDGNIFIKQQNYNTEEHERLLKHADKLLRKIGYVVTEEVKPELLKES
jgi:hypothetical protein